MKTSRLIAERLREVQRHEGGLPAEDSVHEMRVAVRRLRAVLRLAQLRRIDPAAKELQDALGDVRDLHLTVAWLRGRDAALARAAGTRLRKAERALDRAMERWRAGTLPALLDAGARAHPLHLGRVEKVLRKALRRLEERLEVARTRPAPRSLHRARISVKQVRYLVEVGKGSLPKSAARIVPDLKTLQASLGQLHDSDVRISLVRRRPPLLREQREERGRLAAIVDVQLSRWREQRLVSRALSRLR
jgi:CHAD domain-containing protein